MKKSLLCIAILISTVSFLWSQREPTGRAAQKTSVRPPAQAPKQVDFAHDILPIFQATCFSCHGPEKQASNFRLDSKPLAFKGGLNGAAIVPGKPEESSLYRRVAGLGDEIAMPAKGARLTPGQTRLIRDWINQGATWPEELSGSPGVVKKHWAYIKPVRPDPPQVQNQSWVRNPIDNFIL